MNTDEQLMQRVKHNRDRAAYSELVRRYQARVLEYCGGQDADTAEFLYIGVFMAVWKRSSTYTDGTSVLDWILSIATNGARKHSERLAGAAS